MSIILGYLVKAVIVIGPAWAANGAPPFGKKMKGFKKLYIPVCPRFLGTHKTLGGYLLGTFVGFLVGVISHFTVDPYSVCALVAGPLLGLGALAGDSVGSFVKRRIGYKPGDTCWYLDFTDWLPFSWLILYFIYPEFNWQLLLASLFWAFPNYLNSVLFGTYLFRLKKHP